MGSEHGTAREGQEDRERLVAYVRKGGVADHHGSGEDHGGNRPDEDDEASCAALVSHPHGPAKSLGQVRGKDGDEKC